MKQIKNFRKTLKEIVEMFEKKGWKKVWEDYSQGEQFYTFENKKKGLAISIQIYDNSELHIWKK